jgi:hypothetical protein
MVKQTETVPVARQGRLSITRLRQLLHRSHDSQAWDRLYHSCMGSSFLPHGAFPEGGAYSTIGQMHAGSLEALRVARPKAVDLEGN